MLSAVSTSALYDPSLLRSVEDFSDTASTASNLVTGAPLGGEDVLSIAQPESPAIGSGFYERLSLRSRTHAQVRSTEEGQVLAKVKTHLRFQYDFLSTDGTRIRIRAKVNLHYSQTADGDEVSLSIKLKAKIQVSIFQQDVASDVAPLLEAPEVSEEARTAIARSLELFRQVTDAATSLFSDSDVLDGDPLITRLVETSNDLLEAIASTFFPPPGDAGAIPSDDAIALPDQPADEPTPTVTVSPVDVVAEAPSDEGIQANAPEGELFEELDLDGSEVLATVNEELPESGEGEAVDEQEHSDTDARTQLQQLAGSVVIKVRIQMIQSLTSLVHVFDSDASSLVTIRSLFQAQIKLASHYTLSGVDDAPSEGNHVDTQA